MASTTNVTRNLSTPKTRFTSNFGVKGNLAVDGTAEFSEVSHMGAIRTQKIYRIATGADTSDFTEETSGQLDVASNGEGPTGHDSSIRFTQTAISGVQVYVTYSSAVDWSEYDYLGMWYKGGDDNTYASGDIKVGIFEEGNTLWAARTETYSLPAIAPEAATAEWKYFEQALDTANRLTRNAVTRFSFYQDSGIAGNTLDIAEIELYKIGTSRGPARGQVRRYEVANGITVTRGEIVQMDADGRIRIAADNSPYVIGVAVSTSDTATDVGVSAQADVVIDGVVNLKSDETLSAGDGVAVDTGDQPTIDDGGSSFTTIHIQFGVATKTCIAEDVVPVLIGSRGHVGVEGS